MRTQRVFRRALVVGLFPALGWLIPASLWGQAVTVAGATLYADATVAQLRQQAEDLFSTPARFGEAGTMLEQAGRMLPVEDPVAVELMVLAARLEYYAGDLSRAEATMRDAAWRALGQGEPVAAAHAYADAAVIALERKDRAAAEEYVRIVNVLKRWPGVTLGERLQIAKRVS